MKTALQTLREPTPEMLDAVRNCGWGHEIPNVALVWRAMIAEALK